MIENGPLCAEKLENSIISVEMLKEKEVTSLESAG